MDQYGNNDLQRAIDEISNGADNAASPVAEETNAQVNLGEPPVPPTNDFGMPPMEGASVNPPEPATDLDRMTGMGTDMNNNFEMNPAPNHADVSDLGSVRETALKELVPIIDKAGLSADRQFGIIVAVIESSHDKSFIPKALEAARGIADERARAEALLKIVGLIDK